MRFLFWLAARVPSELLAAWLIEKGIAAGRRRERQAMPPPSQDERDAWADGIVYGKTPSGTDVRFDPKSRTWREPTA